MSSARGRLLAALSAQAPSIAETNWRDMRDEIGVYAGSDGDQVLPAVLWSLEHVLRALDEARPLNDSELAGFRAYGQQRAHQGIPTEDMLRGWRLSIRTFLHVMVTVGHAVDVPDATLLEITAELLAITDAATLAFSQGHHEAERHLVRLDQHRRTDFLRGILRGTVSAAEIRRQARQYGLDPDHHYLAVRAHATDALSLESLDRMLGISDTSARRRGMTALVDGDLIGFVDRLAGGAISATVGVGPAAALDRLASAFRQATRALDTATAFAMTGAHDVSSLGLLPAVLAEPDIGSDLAARYLAPLGTGEANQPIIDTLRCYLASGLRVDETAAQMSVHYNTVRYRLKRYEQLTGIDLAAPNRTFEAWWALQYARLPKPHPS